MSDNSKQHFFKLLKDFRNAMLVTHCQDGRLHARPMAIAEIEENGMIWFATGMDTGKVQEIVADAQVSVTLQDSSKFISISGTISLIHDRNKIHELWNEMWKLWFPEGKDSPNIVLLKVDAEAGEYWDNEGVSKLKFIFEAVKAYATHTTPTYDSDLNAKVDL